MRLSDFIKLDKEEKKKDKLKQEIDSGFFEKKINRTNVSQETYNTEIDNESSNKEADNNEDLALRKEDALKEKHSNTTYDIYLITLKVFEKDAVKNRNLVDEIQYRAYVYPLSYPETGNAFMTDIAGYIKNEKTGEFDSKATTVAGKKTLVIELGTHGIILKGRWFDGKFISSAFIMNSAAEDIEITMDTIQIVSSTINGMGHNVKIINDKIYHLLPLREEKKMIVCEMLDQTETVVGCGENEVILDGIRFRYDPEADVIS